MTTRIGFVGLGLMGYGPACCLVDAGYPLVVLGHRNRQPVEDLVSRGAAEARDAADLASAVDVIITCVSSSEVMERLVGGERGFLAGAREGQILADMTTADPRSTRRLAGLLEERGVRMVDAPMTRTPREAREGRLNLLLGGEPADIDAVEPILATFSEHRIRTGPLGSAHTTKLINNFLSLGHAIMALEAAATAEAAGVDPRVLHDIVTVGGADSRMFRMVMPYVLEGDAEGLQFSLRNALKDYGYYLDCARDAGTVPLAANGIHQAIALANALGRGDDHVPRLYDLLKTLRTR